MATVVVRRFRLAPCPPDLPSLIKEGGARMLAVAAVMRGVRCRRRSVGCGGGQRQKRKVQ